MALTDLGDMVFHPQGMLLSKNFAQRHRAHCAPAPGAKVFAPAFSKTGQFLQENR
ncbi:MAG TPA: hypothetical protein VL356_13525 [Acidocella sp.]|jgi:hypothetical protein|nr:hypothetical protein [Acidocella sp.]